MSSVVNTSLRVSSGVKQRSENKNRLILDTTGHTLEYVEGGSLRCGIRWIVPYHPKENNKTIQPTEGTLILGELWERTSANPQQGKRGLWHKIICPGGYYFVNQANTGLAIGRNEKNELVCSSIKNAIIWSD
jgi:hypothetical protein